MGNPKLRQVMLDLADMIDLNDGEIAGFGDLWQREPGEVGRQFAAWLKDYVSATVTTRPPVLRTIRVGTGPRTITEFRAAFQQAGGRVDDLADGALSNLRLAVTDRESEVDLVEIAVSRLIRRPTGGRKDEVYGAAGKVGLQRCSYEDGLQFCLQVSGHRPIGEGVLIASDPLVDLEGDDCLLQIGRDGGGTLLGTDSISDLPIPGNTVMVFRRGQFSV